MDKTKKYSIGLAISLIFFFTLGNVLSSVPNTLSTFPDLLSMVPIPVLLYFFLKNSGKSVERISVKDGIFLGKEVVKNAAFIFAIFTFIYSLFYYNGSPLVMATVSFVMALVGTWVVSIISIAICSWLIRTGYA
ncbi:MAG: hypothetical protein CL670_01635 [Balneola sp.]|mgnify:CR=1 FL=1|jgi:cation transporter-like permease|nr:hypothetical protein [Balneola sp.]MBE77836.1 hypothetical protein [Balneola sp.]|tara:strand:- start:437 stop:838 length:402 start_codon:yes stop_codon:yes gene_type:complete